MSELSPVFTVQVWLDGDDDVTIATADVRFELSRALQNIQDDGLIRDYSLSGAKT